MSSLGCETFEYRSIGTNIRLLRVLDTYSVGKNSIEIEIQDFAIKNTPRYTALSYTWGNPARIQPIIANKKKLDVTLTVWEFLKIVLRWKSQMALGYPRSWPVGYFWIDAVCINQNDVKERSKQVLMMKEIYEKSHIVLVWLGLENRRYDEAFKAINDVYGVEYSDEEEHFWKINENELDEDEVNNCELNKEASGDEEYEYSEEPQRTKLKKREPKDNGSKNKDIKKVESTRNEGLPEYVKEAVGRTG